MSCYLVQSIRATFLYLECSLRAVETLPWCGCLRSDCSGSPKLTRVLPARLQVLQVLGFSFILGNTFLDEMSTDICDLSVLVLPREFRQELPEQNQTSGRKQRLYVLCTFNLGQKTVTKVCLCGWEMCEICASFAVPGIWKQKAAVLPTNPSGAHTLFSFLRCWKVTSFFFPLKRGVFAAFRLPAPVSSYNWAIGQSVEVDYVSHMELETELLLTHPCPVKGENVLTENCIPVLFCTWSHSLVFQTPIIPKPFLLEILFRANILTLTLRNPQKTFSGAVCMHKWAVKKGKLYFL